MYLLDTNTIIHFWRGDPKVVRRFAQFSENNLSISIITAAEILSGMQRQTKGSNEYNRNRQFLNEIKTINLDDIVIECFAQIKFDLCKKGKRVADFDLLIAATALTYGYILITDDRHFNRIPRLEIENWKA